MRRKPFGLRVDGWSADEPAVARMLEEFTGFARNRMWQSRHVLTALDEFAARAGRRGL